MKHDLFEFNIIGMTWQQRAWRIALLITCMIVGILDLFFWRPL